jgi:two-component system phosphate regulon sensor histidine kinase PhoR
VKKKKRLIWQLFPSYLLITVISLGAITWYASNSLRDFFIEQTTSDLEARARILEKEILEYFEPLDQMGIDMLCKSVGKTGSTRFTVILPSGKVIGDSVNSPEAMENHVDRPEILQALRGQRGVSVRYSRTLEESMMYVGIPLKSKSNIVGVIRTSVPLTSIDQAIQSVQIKIVIAGTFIAILAAFLSLLFSRRISRPIEEIKKGAECFANGDLQCRLPVFYSAEIGSLSETMNQMAEDLHARINTIKQQRNQIEAMLSSMVEGVIGVDSEEKVINMNRAAAWMFGCNPYEAQGRSIQEVVRNTEIQQFVTHTLSSGKALEKDIVLYSHGERFVNAHGTLLHNAEGKQIGALIVLNDITRLRRLENIRREFVANVSHEIKTPITAIKGFVETLREGATQDPQEAERFLGIIGKHVDRLDAIIEDLLSLSRIEQVEEKNEVALHEGPIREVLVTAIQLCEAKAKEKNIRLELSCNKELKAKINAALLEQAIANLLDNAVKYSDAEGIIRIEARQADNKVSISVRDQGCGIDKEHLPRIFERFYRADKARSRKLGGTGLGLAIVKHIAQAHGGHVTVESTPGKGSTFTIHLPKS